MCSYCPFRIQAVGPAERFPQVDVAGERVHFLAVHQNLHRRDIRQIHRDRVDDGVDRERFVERSAVMARRDLRAQVDVELALARPRNTARTVVPAGIADA